jgi:xanthine dehydrogenase accessory factor
MNNIYKIISDFKNGNGLAIATIIETTGSTPQKHGFSALFNIDGLISGTIGGGVLEGRVQKIAQSLIPEKRSGIYHFDFDNNISSTQEAICGGEATILIDALSLKHLAVFEKVNKSLKNRIPGVLVAIVTGDEDTNKVINRYWVASDVTNLLPKEYLKIVTAEAETILLSGNPEGFKKIEVVNKGKEQKAVIIFEPVFPPSRLVIAGAGHIGKALAHIGSFLGFEVLVIDDRPEFANKSNIPDADNIIVKDIGLAMDELKKSDDTYIVIVTRGHNDDARALKPCIDSKAAYVGMIGSKTKIAKMHRNFFQNGWATEEQWSSIHAPVGLDIGSKTVEEIAISIAAELVLVRNSKEDVKK